VLAVAAAPDPDLEGDVVPVPELVDDSLAVGADDSPAVGAADPAADAPLAVTNATT
jgi:hypothetical protein